MPLAALAAIFLLILQVYSADFSEYQQKAGVMCSLARYVTWPDLATNHTAEPFRIGILGTDPFGKDLDVIVANQKIEGHPIQVIRGDRARDLGQCHLVFISSSMASSIDEVLKSFTGQPILTVADVPKFIEKGGTVQLTLEGKRVTFDINRGPAHAVGLGFKSRLLQLAKSVR